ncbi:MAG: DUF1858 domain-containing protein [archaeon]|jgi:hybrid cluster-associated redox disulfide protein
MVIKLSKSKKKGNSSGKFFIKKTDLIGDIVFKYPEVTPVFAQAGLHCIGCHVSVSESLQDGCLTHGLNDKEINQLIIDANKRISEFEIASRVSFSSIAINELLKKVKSKNSRYVRIVNSFGGDFDFEPSNSVNEDDVVIKLVNGSNFIELAIPSRIERMLRNVEIDYNSKIKDFSAKRK